MTTKRVKLENGAASIALSHLIKDRASIAK